MLAKAACLAAALVSYILCFVPPSSSKSVDPKKEQRVVSEVKFLTDNVHKVTLVFIATAVLETALYLILMASSAANGSTHSDASHLKGSSSLPLYDRALFQDMRELKTWQMVATTICVLGYALRKWSFVTLDRFFTVCTVQVNLEHCCL